MLFQCIDLFGGTLQVQTIGFFDMLSLELFLQDIQENMKRALRNIYELDGVGQRKLAFCVAIYIVFAVIVTKAFSPKKRTLVMSLK